jgi:hypothetical protein
MNDGSQAIQALTDLRAYLIALEKKYAIIAAVLADLYDIDETSTLREALTTIYESEGKNVPQELMDLMD